MKLTLTATRIPESDLERIKRWVALYNRFHEDKPRFQKLVSSDVIRFAITNWLDTKAAQLVFFPKN